MKLLLTSNGFVNEPIIATCEELVGKSRKEINTIVINEAYVVEHTDHHWLLDDMRRLSENFGGSIELLNLLASDVTTMRERILLCDMIFVTGGHTDYLKTVFDKTGFTELLTTFLSSKVYVGISAGAMIAGKRLHEEARQFLYKGEDTYGNDSYLDLVDFSIMPHLDSDDFEGRRENVLKAAQFHTGMIYGLTDNDAIAVNEKTIQKIGSSILELP